MKTTGKHLDKAAGKFGGWVTTDHYGFGQSLLDMPRMGFRESSQYLVFHFLAALVRIFLSALLIFVLVAFGVPFFLVMLIT